MENQGRLVPEGCVVVMDHKAMVDRRESRETEEGKESRERLVVVVQQVCVVHP